MSIGSISSEMLSISRNSSEMLIYNKDWYINDMLLDISTEDSPCQLLFLNQSTGNVWGISYVIRQCNKSWVHQHIISFIFKSKTSNIKIYDIGGRWKADYIKLIHQKLQKGYELVNSRLSDITLPDDITAKLMEQLDQHLLIKRLAL